MNFTFLIALGIYLAVFAGISIYDLKNMMSYMEKPANTSAPVLIIILIVYIVLVGPAIYLILKAMKKQEIIWYVIPCISLLFVGFVFILSFIGWIILSPFTLFLLFIWLVPYMSVADAIYYDKLKEKNNIK